MTQASPRDEASRSADVALSAATRVARLAPGIAALLILALGALGLLVRHAPPTTWAVPIEVGPLDDGGIVWEIRRAPSEVRVEVGPKGDVATVRIVDRRHPDHVPGEVTTARVRLLPDGGAHTATPAEVGALAAKVRASEARWLRPPSFVAPVGKKVTAVQHAGQIVLEALIVAWLAGLVATVQGWAPALRTRWWAGAAGVVLVQQVVSWGTSLNGVWHSNQHGYDRIADVAQQTPPALAALGLLHGYGYYALFQPLAALTGLGVLELAPFVASAALLVVFAWLRLLWDDGRAALVGTAVLGATPVFLRLARSEDMYLPALLWIVAALALLELYLREDRDRWLLLALPPAFLAMQTRAELMALVPAWAGVLVLLRKPGWLRTGWRRPAVLGGLLVAALLFVPRLLELRASPPPEDLRRASLDPLHDPRLLVLAAIGAAGVAALPWARPRVAAWSRWTWAGVAVLVATVLAAWGAAVVPTGGPLEPTWQLHPALDPLLTNLAIPLLAVLGGWTASRRRTDVVAWLVLAFVIGLAVYLPQYDCQSTYVRTSLATWPFVAALVAGLSTAPRRSAMGAAWPGMLAVSLVWLPGLRELGTRDAKPLQWELVQRADATLPADAVLVWLSDRDLPADAKARGYRTTRARLDAWLPERTVVGVDAWRRGEVSADAPTFFVRTADCHRVLFQPRGQRALAGDVEVGWRYLPESNVATWPRVAVDVPEDWIDPRCAALLAVATGTVVETPLPEHVAGSVYESTFGAAAIGIYRVPSRPPGLP